MTENLKYQNGTFDLSQVQRTQNEYADIYKVTNLRTPNRTKRSSGYIKRRSNESTPTNDNALCDNSFFVRCFFYMRGFFFGSFFLFGSLAII